MVTTITSTVDAGLYRSGWRRYELRAHRRVLARVRDTGLLRTRFEVQLDEQDLTVDLRWDGEVEVRRADRHVVARTTNLTQPTVFVRIDGRVPLRLERSPGRGRWTLSATGEAPILRLAAPARWPGRPAVTIDLDEDRDVSDDPLLVATVACLVLTYRSLTAGLVTGRWARGRPR